MGYLVEDPLPRRRRLGDPGEDQAQVPALAAVASVVHLPCVELVDEPVHARVVGVPVERPVADEVQARRLGVAEGGVLVPYPLPHGLRVQCLHQNPHVPFEPYHAFADAETAHPVQDRDHLGRQDEPLAAGQPGDRAAVFGQLVDLAPQLGVDGGDGRRHHTYPARGGV
ncbi:hypothetical protein ACSNOK_10150 [Streptomyces sp. URMC 126]|uniref:hypothetical protein n=1 Tax=Streptomyces sp. URMC 126 TaxID=3423401 RepID=UPI003F1BD076